MSFSMCGCRSVSVSLCSLSHFLDVFEKLRLSGSGISAAEDVDVAANSVFPPGILRLTAEHAADRNQCKSSYIRGEKIEIQVHPGISSYIREYPVTSGERRDI